MVERDSAHRSAAELLLQAGAPPESAAGHLIRVTPGADSFVVSTLRQAAERSLAESATDAAVGSHPRARRAARSGRAGGGAGRARPRGAADERPGCGDHLRAGLEHLAEPSRRGAVALELGRALWLTDRIGDAFAVFERALDEVDRQRDPDVYELLLAELMTSAGWDPQTYSIAEARIGELDRMRSTEASAATSCLRLWRITSTSRCCTASSHSSSPGARSRPGTCWRAGRLPFITRWWC
jgi:hypothetical protein